MKTAALSSGLIELVELHFQPAGDDQVEQQFLGG
jgi:hypothetical protein